MEGGRSTRDHWRDVETQPVLIRVRRTGKDSDLANGVRGQKEGVHRWKCREGKDRGTQGDPVLC